MDAVGLKPLFDILDTVGLPYIGIATKSPYKPKNTSLSSILAGLKKYLNLNYLFMSSVEADPKNSTNNRIYLGKPRDANVFPA